MSLLERDELARLLNITKTELFSQQRGTREELEGVQEVTCPLRRRSQLHNKIPIGNLKKILCFSGCRLRPFGAEVGGDERGAAEGDRGRELPEDQVFITGGGENEEQGTDYGSEQGVLHTS